MGICLRVFLWFQIFTLLTIQAATANNELSTQSAKLLEIAGTVEFSPLGSDTWNRARAGASLKPGDRLRTQALSRATVQLSDRSVLRIRERTLVVIESPKAEKSGLFHLIKGTLFFLNREKPNQIEFKTPLASGAIRGTEFLITVEENTGRMDLAVYEGEVALQANQSEWSVHSGESIHVAPNETPRKSPLINATNLIQWALYYPMFFVPKDAGLHPTTPTAYATSLEHYLSGDLSAALASLPINPSPGTHLAYELSLQLSVGHLDQVVSALDAATLTTPQDQAFRLLLAAVQFQSLDPIPSPSSPSEWLALSYYHQSQSRLKDAREAAKEATTLAPQFGPAWIRLAELEFSFGYRRRAQTLLEKGLMLSPKQAQGFSLLGFIALENNHNQSALETFEQAITLDGDLGSAWLGKGIASLRLRQPETGRAALQTAAALEPQRSLFRSYLAKAFSEIRDDGLAEKELRIARKLDASDPTPAFYGALHAFQRNRINDSIRLLEESIDLNDNRSLHRSRFLLDKDLAMRSADVAVLYADAGMTDVSEYRATQAILYDPSNFSGHLFLANSLQNRERRLGIDHRWESARASEWLTANLLAPLGSGNLSQLLSQQDHLHYFNPRPLAFNTTLEYQSNQAWNHESSAFGTIDRHSYAFDASYLDQSGQRPNQNRDLTQASFQWKIHWTPSDSLYVQTGTRREDGDDLRSYYDPKNASSTLRFESEQPANLYLGYHREWAPNSHTMILASRLEETLNVTDSDPRILFVPKAAGTPTRIETSPGFDLSLESEFTLYSAELQHLFSFHPHSLIVGSRIQFGEVDQRAILSRDLTGIIDRHTSAPPMERANAYAYYSWEITDRLRWIAGIAYDHLETPVNTDLAPITQRTRSQDLIAPKIGLTYEPWNRGEFRAAYTQSLGGLFFDSSVRLEPSLVAGFNQSYRSLIPESVAGLTPGSRFETIHGSFNQSWRSGTYIGANAEILESKGDRGIGALTNRTPLPLPDSPITLTQNLKYREESVAVYAHQLIEKSWAPGVRYRFSHATLSDQFHEIPNGIPGEPQLSQRNEASLQELNLFLWYNHSSGLFGRWESNWYSQDNASFTGLRDDRFWQHDLYLGYRFTNRRAQLQFGLLNLFDADYRLNPINLHAELPRRRTLSLSARFNF